MACCNSPHLIQTPDGMNVCEACATEHGPVIDTGAEWRHYADDSGSGKGDPSRCGASADGFPSTYGSTFRIAFRRGHTASNAALLQSLRSHSSLPGEKSLLRNFARIENVLSIYHQPRGVILLAQQLFKNLSDSYTTRGASREGQIVNAVRLAYEQMNFPKSMEEISEMFMLDRHQAIKSAKKADQVAQKLGMAQKDVTPFDLVPQMCSQLALDQPTTMACMYVAFKWNQLQLEIQNTPKTTTGALVCMVLEALGTSHSRELIAKAAHMCSVSLDKCVKKVMVYRDVLMEGIPSRGAAAILDK